MARARYLRVARPWDATLDLSTPVPARFYLSLIAQTLEYGSPASRRWGRAWALVGRRGIPETAMAHLLRRGGQVLGGKQASIPELEVIARSWPRLRAQDPTLPASPSLTALALTRASARTVFFFDASPAPLVVAKIARRGCDDVEREVAALQEAAGSGLAPRYLGAVDGAGHVQRGLAGRALSVAPIRAGEAGLLPWTAQHAALTVGLQALARATRKAAPAVAPEDDIAELGLEHPRVSQQTRREVREAIARLRQDPAAVLTHGDASAQNILFDGERLVGLVDWAASTPVGMPGIDLWNSAMARIDKGVGLVSWNEPDLLEAFEAAWFDSPFGRTTRAAARACAAAAGADDELHYARELFFFARRLGHRTRSPASYTTSAALAAQALEVVRTRLGPA